MPKYNTFWTSVFLNKRKCIIMKYHIVFRVYRRSFRVYIIFPIWFYKVFLFVIKNTNSEKMKRILFILFITTSSFAQEKPVSASPIKPTPVEFLFGHKRIQGQTIIIKNFAKSKFGIFSLTTLEGDYKNVDKSNNEVFSNVQFHYDFYKGLKVTSGATFSSAKGFAPIAGLEYVYNNPKITLVINPTINLTKESSLASYAHIEYVPKNDKLNFYARLQGLYVQSLADNAHERSSAVLRIGITYKGFATGLGLNQDYYGPAKVEKPNFGIFLHYKFI